MHRVIQPDPDSVISHLHLAWPLQSSNPKIDILIIFLFFFPQMRFVKNVSSWREMKPGFYHGHISYLDFAKYGLYS